MNVEHPSSAVAKAMEGGSNVQHRMMNGKKDDKTNRKNHSIHKIGFSFDVGISMFNVGRSFLNNL